MSTGKKIGAFLMLLIGSIVAFFFLKRDNSEGSGGATGSNAFDGNISFNGTCYQVSPKYDSFDETTELEWSKYSYALNKWVMPSNDDNKDEFENLISLTKGFFKGINAQATLTNIRQNKDLILEYANGSNPLKHWEVSVGELRCSTTSNTLAYSLNENRYSGTIYIDPNLK